MDLMDLYVSEVGRRLPQKGRADIEAEIRSVLQDLVDERSRRAGKPADDEMVLAVLKEYGDPENVATSYARERYLIGPRLYPTFVKVVFTVVPITVVLVLTGLGSSLFLSHSFPRDWIQLVAQAIGNLIETAVLTVGVIALIFAILEWTVPEFKLEKTAWDPRSLLRIKPPDRIRTGSLIANILFTSLAILVFNFSPGAFSIGYENSGVWWVCFICTSAQTVWRSTVLSAAFFRYLPALDILWSLSVVLSILLLSRGHWQTPTRWFDAGLKALSVGIAIAMLAGPSLVGVPVQALNTAGFPDPAAALLIVDLLNPIVRLVLVLAILGGGWELIRQLIRLLQSPKPIL